MKNTKTPRIIGLVICIAAATLMVIGTINVGWGAAFGMVGVGLLASTAHTRNQDTE